MKNGRIQGFTLVELLVVIAIISILAALLLPAMENAIAQGRKTACLSNAKQATLSMFLWMDDKEGALPSYFNPDDAAYVNGPDPAVHGFTRWQAYLVDRYLDGSEGAVSCPSSKNLIRLDVDQNYTFFAQMCLANFGSFTNPAQPHGHWLAPAGAPIRLDRVVSPHHKILYMDNIETPTPSNYAFYGTIPYFGGSVYKIYYDNDHIRHMGGINTIMMDGHGEFHFDSELGTGTGAINNTTRRYWWALNIEQ